MAKTALIVDDSAAARLALGRMLAEQDLSVDTAESGEEAMVYLRQARPDVIFMDHLMPGMDGFEALEAIKENPATATIPVMMYTSQEGELYVGQARALGAFGVLPKQIEPVEVTKVLRALHLIPEQPGGEIAESGPSAEGDNARVGELLEDLFRQQHEMLRDEIRRGYERLSEAAALTSQQPTLTEPEPWRAALKLAGTICLALGVVTFAYLYFEASGMLEAADERFQVLLQSQQPAPAAPVPDAGVSGTGADLAEITELLEWGINQGGSYRFGVTALDAERAQQLAVLADRLRNAGFTGTVVVSVHLGRYCMNLSGEGGLILPPVDQLAEDCQQVGWPESEAIVMGEQQTLPFANTIALATRTGDIRFEIASLGSSAPRVAYPLFAPGLTAGEWNAVAARNQRVDVRIVPE